MVNERILGALSEAGSVSEYSSSTKTLSSDDVQYLQFAISRHQFRRYFPVEVRKPAEFDGIPDTVQDLFGEIRFVIIEASTNRQVNLSMTQK